jgi:hypothetical protein
MRIVEHVIVQVRMPVAVVYLAKRDGMEGIIVVLIITATKAVPQIA